MKRIISDIEELVCHFNSSNEKMIFLSTYFTSKLDPLRRKNQEVNSFAYFRNWYESIFELEIMAIIFCDTISEEFKLKYETDKISFVRCQLGPHSLNDERFFIFYEFVQQLKSDCYVVSTDINDVIVNKNPLDLLESHPEKLFVGRGIRRTWKDGIWALYALRQFNNKIPFRLDFSFLKYPMLTPGTIGGKNEIVQKIYKEMIDLFSLCGDEGNYDMQVFNYVMKKKYFLTKSSLDGIIPFIAGNWFYYLKYRLSRKLEKGYKKSKYDVVTYEESICQNDLIYAGFPFVSIVGNYEKKGESEAYLIHK